MILAASSVTGFLVASVYAVGMLRGRRDRYHRLGLPDPVHGRRDRDADPDSRRRHRGARDRERPADQVRGDGVRHDDRLPTRPSTSAASCNADGRQGRDRDPRPRLVPGRRPGTDTEVTGLDSVPPDDRPPAQHDAALAFDTMVGIWHGADRCSALWFAVRLVAAARTSPTDAVVPARVAVIARVAAICRARVRLDRHRGRAPAVDRLRRSCAPRTRSPTPAAVWCGPSSLSIVVLYAALGHRAACWCSARCPGAGARATSTTTPSRTAPARSRRRSHGRSGLVSTADGCAVVLWVGVTLYAVFGGADFGAGFWDLTGGGAERGARAPRADRPLDRARLGGQPRLADLRARRALDRLPARLLGDLLHARSSR